jgi:hypothetical protein|nr:MAG TPA: hypothetical protein [Caudoviricetes sp.]
MSKGEQLTNAIMYLIDTWQDENMISDFDYKNYNIIANGGTLKQKKSVWHDLVGSEFEFE